MRDVKIGVLLATRGLVMRAQREGTPANAETFLELVERAEAAGLDSIWVGDSLVSKPRLEPVTALAAAAARTKCSTPGAAQRGRSSGAARVIGTRAA